MTVHPGDSPLGPLPALLPAQPGGRPKAKQMTLSWRRLARVTEKALKARG